mmetsp:Transcript_48988/g.163493  ORF Transcript_48988/g.163493 Transcript_48988/m.163493 type:complete len:233 (+) Transcript_48988:531-1229(+)
MRRRAAEPGMTTLVSSHQGAYRTATATRDVDVGLGGIACHSRESITSTEPALPVARTSCARAAVGSESTPGAVGLVVARCEPGRRMVPFSSFIGSSIHSVVRWQVASAYGAPRWAEPVCANGQSACHACRCAPGWLVCPVVKVIFAAPKRDSTIRMMSGLARYGARDWSKPISPGTCPMQAGALGLWCLSVVRRMLSRTTATSRGGMTPSSTQNPLSSKEWSAEADAGGIGG